MVARAAPWFRESPSPVGKFLANFHQLKVISRAKRQAGDHVANVGVEPKTFELLARRSNQL
ncbi:hypothetical protein BV25DRAFT_1829611, partial [Artomyces pyxidatus]